MPSGTRLPRIALLTDGIHPFVMGGMQRHSYYLAKYLALAGWEVDLYHRKTDANKDLKELPGLPHEAQINVHLVPVPFPSMGSLPGHYMKESYRYSEQIFKLLEKREPADIIYAKGFTAWSFFKMGKGRKFPPLLLNMHGLEMFQSPINLRQRMEQYLLRGP